MNSPTNQFGCRLKQLRTQNKVTQDAIATLLNVRRNTVSTYESGGRKPDYDALMTIARFFNVTVDYLIGNSDEFNIPAEIDDILRSCMYPISPEHKENLINDLNKATTFREAVTTIIKIGTKIYNINCYEDDEDMSRVFLSLFSCKMHQEIFDRGFFESLKTLISLYANEERTFRKFFDLDKSSRTTLIHLSSLLNIEESYRNPIMKILDDLIYLSKNKSKKKEKKFLYSNYLFDNVPENIDKIKTSLQQEIKDMQGLLNKLETYKPPIMT
jgi:transcriptional regulator with XRE-family HTH domain